MIDALSFFGVYPFRRVWPIDIEEVTNLLKKHGFKKIYIAYMLSLFYRDFYEANKEAEENFNKAKNLAINTILLPSINPDYMPLNKSFLKDLLENKFFQGYVTAPAYQGYKIDSLKTIRVFERLCEYDKRVIIIDLLEDIREMHRAYKMRHVITKESLKNFIDKIDRICERKILLTSFRYDLLKEVENKISEKEFFIDTSSDTLYGPQYDRIKELTESIGHDLIVLATKTPLTYPSVSIYRVLYSDISDSFKKDILERNILRFYGSYAH